MPTRALWLASRFTQRWCIPCQRSTEKRFCGGRLRGCIAYWRRATLLMGASRSGPSWTWCVGRWIWCASISTDLDLVCASVNWVGERHAILLWIPMLYTTIVAGWSRNHLHVQVFHQKRKLVLQRASHTALTKLWVSCYCLLPRSRRTLHESPSQMFGSRTHWDICTPAESYFRDFPYWEQTWEQRDSDGDQPRSAGPGTTLSAAVRLRYCAPDQEEQHPLPHPWHRTGMNVLLQLLCACARAGYSFIS